MFKVSGFTDKVQRMENREEVMSSVYRLEKHDYLPDKKGNEALT